MSKKQTNVDGRLDNDLNDFFKKANFPSKKSKRVNKASEIIRSYRVGERSYTEYANGMLVESWATSGTVTAVREKFATPQGGLRLKTHPLGFDYVHYQNPAGYCYYDRNGNHAFFLRDSNRVIRTDTNGRALVSKAAAVTAAPLDEYRHVFTFMTFAMGQLMKPDMFAVLAQQGMVYLCQYEPREDYEPKLPFVANYDLLPLVQRRLEEIDPGHKFARGLNTKMKNGYALIHRYIVNVTQFGLSNQSQFERVSREAEKMVDIYRFAVHLKLISHKELYFFRDHLYGAVAHPEKYS